LFAVCFFVDVIRGPLVQSVEQAQRRPSERNSAYRLLQLQPISRSLFTPPPHDTQATTPAGDATIEWQQPQPPTAEQWDEMKRIFAALMDVLIMFCERFIINN